MTDFQKQEADRKAGQRAEDGKKRLALDGRDLDRDGDIDLADSVINDLDRDGRIDSEDREQLDLDNDLDLDAADRALTVKMSVGAALGKSKTTHVWQQGEVPSQTPAPPQGLRMK